MDFNLSQILLSFLFSIALGFCLGAVYEIIRIFHMCGFKNNLHYFITDFIFIIFCGLVTYFYCLVMLEGKVRFFIIAGIIVGFCGYILLVAPFTEKIFAPIIKFSKKVFSKLLKNCQQIMYNIVYKFSCLFSFLKSISFKKDVKVNEMVKNNGRKKYKAQRKKRRKNKRSENT